MTTAPTPIRIAGYHPETTVHSRAVRHLQQVLRADAADLCTPHVTPSIVDLGHKTSELLGLVAGGAFDIAYMSSIPFQRYVPELAAFDIPFLLASRDRALEVLDRGIRPMLDTATDAGMPVRVLAIWDNGARQITNNVRPIRMPEDCQGLVLRTQQSDTIGRGFTLIGFKVVQIDIGKLGAAISAGEVDAQENPLINTLGFGIDRLHPHVSLTSHIFGATLLACNCAAWERWPPALRVKLTAAVASATALQRRLAIEEDTIVAAQLTRQGNLLQAIEPAARRAFAARVAPLHRDVHELLASPALAGLLDG